MNLLMCSGRLGKDAKSFQTQKGTDAVSFSVATDVGYGENKQTVWYSCVLFGKRATTLASYLVKGQAVIVYGEPKIDSYTDKDGNAKYFISITLSDLDLIGSAPNSEQRQERPAPTPPRPSKPQAAAANFADDMPF